MLLLVWVIEICFFSIFYSKYQKANAHKVAKTIIESKLENDNESALIENLAYENNLCIFVYSAYGEVKEYNSKMIGCNIQSPQSMKHIYSFLANDSKQKTYHLLFAA